jgi:hypothetical protein
MDFIFTVGKSLTAERLIQIGSTYGEDPAYPAKDVVS